MLRPRTLKLSGGGTESQWSKRVGDEEDSPEARQKAKPIAPGQLSLVIKSALITGRPLEEAEDRR